eukprot:CAMPEP_0116873972 /NCGR_PEP_ID=MMETSP0463-20121206/5336_1 /TAXON_ID=181622 /ORGANISM="Strombidinopsis sp, Strain SopsisLIS2011" /LENGTH=51 /DNA_ID=CAMNT_0004516955 /DNA_START=2424 /DNA_END=2579 /DNA_ORIENTATION=+
MIKTLKITMPMFLMTCKSEASSEKCLVTHGKCLMKMSRAGSLKKQEVKSMT